MNAQLEGTACRWCGAALKARRRRGSPQMFCSTGCRLDYHAACRIWSANLVEAGLLPVVDLRSALEKRVRLNERPNP